MIELNKVYNEDCLTGMQRIPDKSIDMILCDLPYGTTACKWDVVIPFEPLWEQYERVIKDNGAIVLTASQPFTSALVMSNINLFRYELIYEKTKSSLFQNVNKMPMKNHENILLFYKKLPNYNPQKTFVGIKDKREIFSLRNADKTGNFIKGLSNHGAKKDDGYRMPVSVNRFNNSDKTNLLHPTQKPVALFEYLIKTYTNEGETVLDNCMGSGTTAIACINTNRNYMGFEKDEKYFNIIQDRIKKHTVQLKLIIET